MSNVTVTRAEIVAAAYNFAESMREANDVSHSGVKGMKWGVWNDETKRKYGIGVRTKAKFTGGTEAAKTLLSRTAAKMNARAETRKAARASAKAAKQQLKAELKAQRKELGMTRKEFDKLRDTTLKSHDPKVIAKGMHTLTDSELKEKIRRLQEEDKITKLSYSKQQQEYATKSARNKALSSNPFVSVGQEVAKGFLTDTVKSLGYDTVVQKGLQPVLERKVERWAKEAKRRDWKAEQDDVTNEMAPYVQKARNARKAQEAEQRRTELRPQTEETIRTIKTARDAERQRKWDADVQSYAKSVQREYELERAKRVSSESAQRTEDRRRQEKLEADARRYAQQLQNERELERYRRVVGV